MKIAVDGGAFQQGIAAGIYNVGVGLLNEMSRLAPDMSFVFVTDPRMGPPRRDLLQALNFVPELVEAPVSPAFAGSGLLKTADPHVVFEIDGRLVPASTEGGVYRFKGVPPRRLARLHSRVDQPSASGSTDARYLGVGIREIRVKSGNETASVPFTDPRLADGFHSPDQHIRWTKGAACLPQSFFDVQENDIQIEIDSPGQLQYQLKRVASEKISNAIRRLKQAAELALLERRLEALDCEAYLANHFISISFKRLRNYAILHDVVPVKFPEFFLDDARENFKHVMRTFVAADHIFSVSESSRRDLIEVADVSADRVTTFWNDIDPQFRPPSRQAISDVRKRYGLDAKPFVLCVGTIEPRKNHIALLRAFLASRARSTHTLAVVGKRGWGVDIFFSELERSRATADVRVFSDVPTEHLPMLYAGAALLAYPSRYEGFGLPVVEAMACGCPVLTSNCSSMADIGEGAAILVDPASETDIAAAIDRLASSRSLQADLRAKGLERRARFNWADSAAKVLEVIDR